MSTRLRVLDYVKTHRHCAVPDIKGALGLSRSVVCRHLNRLCSRGLIQRAGAVARPYSDTGRGAAHKVTSYAAGEPMDAETKAKLAPLLRHSVTGAGTALTGAELEFVEECWRHHRVEFNVLRAQVKAQAVAQLWMF
jgi:DNA-binding Lrp family transcriptional regulator